MAQLRQSGFFTYVTSRVVVAVPRCQVGASQVEEVLARLTTWQVAALAQHMRVTLLTGGKVTLREDGLPHHHTAQPLPLPPASADQTWSVLSLHGRGVHVYVVLNVGREGWCVVTEDFNTLVHVLHAHGMHAPHLAGQTETVCDEVCAGKHALVPRARAGLRHYTQGGRMEISILKSRARWARQVAQDMEAEAGPLNHLASRSLALYTALRDVHTGLVLLAGFDLQHHQHRAAGRTDATHQLVVVSCDQGHELDFLARVAPLLRACQEADRNTFIRYFTQINPLPWEEVAAAVGADGGLRVVAFRQVCALPLPYLEQNAPPALYAKVLHYQTLVPWTDLAHLKTPQDIT